MADSTYITSALNDAPRKCVIIYIIPTVYQTDDFDRAENNIIPWKSFKAISSKS